MSESLGEPAGSVLRSKTQRGAKSLPFFWRETAISENEWRATGRRLCRTTSVSKLSLTKKLPSLSQEGSETLAQTNALWTANVKVDFLAPRDGVRLKVL
jgi:hypothetical protein